MAVFAVGSTVVHLREHGQRVHQRLREAVEPLGLAMGKSGYGARATASGEVEGVRIDVSYLEPAPRAQRGDYKIEPRAVLRVELVLPGRMPAGQRVLSQGVGQELVKLLGGQDIELGDAALDPLLRVVSREPEATRALLTRDGVAQALRILAGNIDLSLDLDGNRLVVTQTAANWLAPAPTVTGCIRLGLGLREALDAPWRDLARRLELQVVAQGSEGGRTLSGRVGAVELKVVLGSARDDDEAPQTRITAGVWPALPGGVRMRGRARGAPRAGLSTGDPVLDSVLDVQATDADAARRLLARPEVTGPLLEVLHGLSGSYVHPRGVVIVAEGWLREELAPTVDRAVALAATLSQVGAEGDG